VSERFGWFALTVLVIVGVILWLVHLTGTPTLKPAGPLSKEPAPIRKYEVIAEYPHDPKALTQGLIYHGGILYESTGGQGQSTIRKVELKTGRVLQQRAVENGFLGEGLTEWHGQLIQFASPQKRSNRGPWTLQDLKFVIGSYGQYWDRITGFRYDADSLEAKSTFAYNANGWGLTHDDHQFIKSDGTSLLRFLNADTLKWKAQIAVVDNGVGIRWLNELEFVKGMVYANIWQQDRIAIIQPNSGQITGWIDLSELKSRMVPPPKDIEELGPYGKAVANGIAYDAQAGRLFVTGKNWPRLFEIRVHD